MPKGVPYPQLGKIKRKRNPGSALNIAARKREQQAIQLRLGGYTYEEAAARIKINGKPVTAVSVYNMVMRVLDRQQEDTLEMVPKMRAIELNRCDTYLKAMLPQAKKGNVNTILACLKVAERRARLCGLDAPTKIDPLAGDGGAVAVELFRKMLDDATAGKMGDKEEKKEAKA